MLEKDFNQAFLVVSATARTTPDYPIRGYAGPSGRLDVIARSILASMTCRETLFIALLLGPPNPPKTLIYHSDKCTFKSERMVMMEIKRAYLSKSKCLEVEEWGIDEIVYNLVKSGFEIVMLREDGVDVSRARRALIGRKVYVLGSHVDVPSDIERGVSRYVEYRVSIGPRSVYTSHAILYILWARRVLSLGNAISTPR